jgi:hypothetical protein
MSSSEAEFDDEEEEEEEEDGKDDGSYKDNDGGGDDDEDDEDEEEEEAPREDRKRASRKSVVSYAENDDDDDDDEDDNGDDDSSDDDMPLAQLAAKMKKKAPAAAATNGKKAPATKKAAAAAPPAKKKKKKTTASSSSAAKATTNGSSSSSNKKYEWASAALYGSNCDKGRLSQEILCRWWYAYTWPDPKTLPKKPPDNYDCLDGFPGVYVCTAGDDVGKILDKRDASQTPSFANMAKKTASELQEMLLKALERQKQELIQHEGTGTSTEKDIDNLIKWTKRVNTDKADREAKKVLLASKIKI